MSKTPTSGSGDGTSKTLKTRTRAAAGSPTAKVGEKQGSNLRQYGRVRCEMTTCDVGEVLDASAAGMRIRSRWKIKKEPGDVVTLKVDGTMGPFEVQGRVIWAKRRGFMRHEMGIHFVDVPKQVRSALNMIAQSAASNLSYETSLRRKAG